MMGVAHEDKGIAAREQSTVGTITIHQAENHNRYGYTFHVSGHDYGGWETFLKAEPEIGQSVRVYFDPLQPANNALTDFADLGDRWFARGIALLIFSAFFIAVVLLLGLFRTAP
jgi:hypothetical protein